MTAFPSQRERHLAQSLAARLVAALQRRRLKPAFRAFYLTHLHDLSWLIADLDTTQLGDHRPYSAPDLLHQLSTDLGGVRLYLSNHSGLRYVLLLSPLPRLPRKVSLPPDVPRGRVALGVKPGGKAVLTTWEALRHLAVLGISGSGKSVFLRLLAYQALRDGLQLLVADVDQATFPMLRHHPGLAQPPATTPAEAHDLLDYALQTCEHRAALFQALPEYPETLAEYNAAAVRHGREVLPRLLVILDEASATLSALGGGKGHAAGLLAALGWRGRKFGVHFVFAAQEFTKALLGPIREQVGLVVCFRVRSAEMARRLGCPEAHRLPEGRPGLAVSDRYGFLQTYYLDKQLLAAPEALRPVLSPEEEALFRRAQQADGVLSRSRLMRWGGLSAWQARKRLQQWAQRGWVQKDPQRANAYVLTARGRDLLTNPPTSPTAANLTNPLPAAGTQERKAT